VENINGTGLRQLTPYGLAYPHETASARWSPDGQTSSRDDTRHAVRRPPDGPGLSMIRLHTGTTRYFARACLVAGRTQIARMSINGQRTSTRER
jgi:hypothetical protein